MASMNDARVTGPNDFNCVSGTAGINKREIRSVTLCPGRPGPDRNVRLLWHETMWDVVQCVPVGKTEPFAFFITHMSYYNKTKKEMENEVCA